MMRGSSKGGRARRLRWVLAHTPALLLFIAYWTPAAFSAVLATDHQRKDAGTEEDGTRKGIIGGGGGPAGISVAMSPALPSSSCQPGLRARLEVQFLLLCYKQFVTRPYSTPSLQCRLYLLCVAKCTLLAAAGVEPECL